MQNVWDVLENIVTNEYLVKGIGLAVTWIAVWILVRYLSRWIEAFDERIKGVDIDARELGTLDRLLDYAVIIVAVMISLSILGWTQALYSLLTAAGVIGIIVGFAVKDVAANFISGVFILIDQPFVVDDAISVSDYSGTVREISLRSTEITTWDGPVVSIPNSTMATTPVINYSVNPTRRVNVTFSIAYEEDVDNALDVVRTVIEVEERRDQDQEAAIYVSDVREYAIDITALFHVPRADWFAVVKDFRPRVLTEFRRRGVELAVPVRKNIYLGEVPQPVRKWREQNRGG
jgi:small conductance mechanosensitive channel